MNLHFDSVLTWSNSPPQCKNAVCALQINCKLFPFPLEKSCRNEQTSNSLPYLIYQTCLNKCGMGVDWSEIVFLMKVSSILLKCTFCIFTLYRENWEKVKQITYSKSSIAWPYFLYPEVNVWHVNHLLYNASTVYNHDNALRDSTFSEFTSSILWNYFRCVDLLSWYLLFVIHFYPLDTLSKVALYSEKIHKVFKHKVQGCSILSMFFFSFFKSSAFKLVNN